MQRNAASILIPGSWEFIKCLAAIYGGGVSRPHSQGWFSTCGEKPPLAPFKIDHKETFARSPTPTSSGPHPSPQRPSPSSLVEEGCGRPARFACSGSRFSSGRRGDTSPTPRRSHPVQPPGRSSLLCGPALPPLRGARRGRWHLEFCPKKGAWRRRRRRRGTEPAARKRIWSAEQPRGEDRGGGGSEDCARPQCISRPP